MWSYFILCASRSAVLPKQLMCLSLLGGACKGGRDCGLLSLGIELSLKRGLLNDFFLGWSRTEDSDEIEG